MLLSVLSLLFMFTSFNDRPSCMAAVMLETLLLAEECGVSIGAFDGHKGSKDGDIGSSRAGHRSVVSAWGMIEALGKASKWATNSLLAAAPATGVSTDEATDTATQSQQVFGCRVPVLDADGLKIRSLYGGECTWLEHAASNLNV